MGADSDPSGSAQSSNILRQGVAKLEHVAVLKERLP